MAIDSDSHELSDGDVGSWRSPLFASMQHFSGSPRRGRHDRAFTPALAVAGAALVFVYVWECVGNLAGLRGRCLVEDALRCKCRYKQCTSGCVREHSQIRTGYVKISTGILVRADSGAGHGLGYVQI